MIQRSLLHVLLLITALSACSDKGPKVYLREQPTSKKVIDGDATEYFDPKADILFVIDDSASMATHQQNLADNITRFTSVFVTKSVLDYNVGVVTTDNVGTRNPCCGRLVGNIRVVNKKTPNTDRVLAQNLLVGTGGNGIEAPFSTAVDALSSRLLTTWNLDFIRPDAALVVVFITDAEDQTDNVSAQTLYNHLLALKGGDPKKLLAYGAIIPSGERNCERDDGSTTPVKIEEFLNLVPNAGKNVLSLCATDFGERLADFAAEIVAEASSIIYLSRSPKLETIRVVYGTAELAKDPKRGWSYSPKLNAIILGENIDWASQPPGSQVRVYYDAARFPEE